MNDKKNHINKKKESEKETKNALKFLIGFSIAIIIILGFTIYPLYHNKIVHQKELKNNMYHGFQFQKNTDGHWVVQVTANGMPYVMPFYYHPRDVENITFDEAIAHSFIYPNAKPKMIYISIDPNAGSKPVVAGVELSRILGKKYKLFNYPVQSALSKPEEGVDLLVKNCSDAINGTVVIEFNQGPVNAVYAEKNCVHVEYKSPEDSIKVADRFDYTLLGII